MSRIFISVPILSGLSTRNECDGEFMFQTFVESVYLT
jgi:hypothetical protein